MHVAMKASLRALLEHAIDYAGLFPPASLSLPEAAGNYTAYSQSAESWLLGQFVCPAARLQELSALAAPGMERVRVTMLAGKTATSDAFLHELELDVAQVHDLRCQLEGFEARLPDEVQAHPGTAPISRLLHAAVARAMAADWPVAGVFLEASLAEPAGSEAGGPGVLEQTIAALGDYNSGAASRKCPAGLKLRTGGVKAAAFPSAQRLAAVICACRDARLFWKATAGLHHPLPQANAELGIRMHGFVNLHVAAVLAVVHELSRQQVEELLLDDQPGSFQFDEQWLSWRDLKADTDQVTAARARSLVSFGSCDFAGPCRELHALGWL
jgi:hypothetical protein